MGHGNASVRQGARLRRAGVFVNGRQKEKGLAPVEVPILYTLGCYVEAPDVPYA